MILMLAPAPGMTFGAAPSGATYVADQFALVKVTSDNSNDQAFLASAGCYTLTPFGGWGTFHFNTVSDLYAADAGVLVPGITGFPQHTMTIVTNDGTGSNNGTWAKTGSGHGSGNWTRISGTVLSAAGDALASAMAAAASASAAAGSQTAAGNSATTAAGSATSAGNSATSASGSATSAGNSATAAAGSASAAAGSATSAGNSATAASGSASTAGAAATAATSAGQIATFNAARDQLTKSVITARANLDTKDPAQNWIRFVDASFGITLTSATYDAATDTYTIAAGGSVAFALPSTSTNLATPWVPTLDPLTRYLAVATIDDDASALVCKLQSTSPAPVVVVYTLPDFVPGVKMGSLAALAAGKTGFALLITNTGATSKTIFCPYAGTGYPIIERVTQKFRYHGRPIERRDYSFNPVGSRPDASAREAAKTVWVDSVAGSDSNNGTSYSTPKQTLSFSGTQANGIPLLPSGSRIGLMEGSVFNTPLLLSGSGANSMLDRVEVGRVSKGGRTGLPLFDQTTEPAVGTWVSNGDGSWSYTFTQLGLSNTDAASLYYSSVGVIIGVAATVATKPMTSWRRMMEGSGVGTYPGKFSTSPYGGSNLTTTPVTYTVTVWPPDGLAPGTGAYRYRVVNSGAGLLWQNQIDLCVGWLSDCDFFSSSGGYGSIQGPGVLYAKNVVTRHATTHNTVMSSGHLKNWMIWDRGNANSIGLTFYKPDPTGLNWSLTDILAFGTNGMNSLYAHNGGGGSYGTGLIRRACVYDPVAETVALPAIASIGGQATQTITYEDCYINNGNAFGFNISSESGGIRNLRRNILVGNAIPFYRNAGTVGQCTIENNFARTRSWSDSTSPGNRGSLFMNGAAVLSGTGNSVDVQHNTAHLRATAQTLNNDGALSVYGSSRPNNNKYNIFVLEWLPGINTQSSVLWTIDYNNPGDWNSDYNFIVLCGARPALISSNYVVNRTAGPPNGMDWDTYRSVTSQDAHSFFIDLRGDPLGAALVWNNPDADDYSPADTPYGAMLDRWQRTYDTGCPFTLNGLPRVPDPDRQYIEMRNH